MPNPFSHLRAFSLMGCALLLATGATAGSRTMKEGLMPKEGSYNLAVDIDAPGAVRARLEIQSPDLKEALRYELGAKDGGISGGIYIPPGKENRVSITAFDERGEPLYEGSGYANVDEKLTRETAIALSGKETRAPLLAKLGTYRLEVGFGTNEGDGFLLETTLLDAYGNHIPFKPDDVKWELPFEFELLPYSCFRESLCIELPKPDLQKEAILICFRDITCWSKPPKDTRGPYRYVTVGLNHTCALTIANDIRCWGDNKDGQLGARGVWCPQALGYECSTVPLPVECPAGEVCKFRSVAAGGDHTCAVDTAGKAWCWGEDGNAATGVPSSENPDGSSIEHRYIPAFTDLGGKVDFIAIDTDRNHTCALSAANDVYCWGDNAFDQLGFPRSGGTWTARATLVRSGSKYASVVTGMNHTCAIQTNQALDCWGENFNFQLASSLPGAGLNGHTMFATLNSKVPLLGGKGVSRVAAGATSTCAENYNAHTICWGSAQHFTPPNNATSGFVALHYSYALSMATERDSCAGGASNCTRTCVAGLGGDLFCGNWTSAIPPQLPLVAEPASDRYIVWNQVDVGENHVCALTSQRDVWCFGIDKFGQFGTGATSTVRTFAPVTAVNR
jgi:hypothetical protein